jgi:hypothetical protein
MLRWAAAAVLLFRAGLAGVPPAALYQDPILWRFHPGARLAVAQLSARTPELLAQLERELGFAPNQSIEIWVLPGNSGPEVEAPRWAAAFAQPGRSRIIVRQLEARRALALLQHELVHLVVHQSVRGPLPRWFDEGLAVIYGGEWGMAEALRAAASSFQRDWLPLEECEADLHGADPERARQAYLESAAFVLHLRSTYGTDAPRRILVALAAGSSFAEAFRAVTGAELTHAERAFLGAPKSDWLAALLRLAVGAPLMYAGMAALALVAALVFFRRQRRRRAALELEEWSSDSTVH